MNSTVDRQPYDPLECSIISRNVDVFSPKEKRPGLQPDNFFVNRLSGPYATGAEIPACHEGSDHCPVMEMEIPGKVSREGPGAPGQIRGSGAGIPS